MAVAIDTCAVFAALGAAAVVRYGALGAIEVARPGSSAPWLLTPPIWILTIAAFGLYNPVHSANAVEEARRVATAGLAAPASFVVVSFMFKEDPSRLWLGLSTLFGLLAIGIGRRVLRWVGVRNRLRGRWITPAVVVGRSEAKRLVDLFIQEPTAGFKPVATSGFVWDGLPSSELGEIGTVVKSSGAGAILIVSEDLGREEVQRAVAIADDHPVSAVVLSGLDHTLEHSVHVLRVGKEPALVLEAPALRIYQRLLKRALDVSLAFLALVVLSPLLLVIAAAIKIDTRGPAIFRQRRIGKEGKTFGVLKFRTMRHDAEQDRSRLAVRNESDGLLFKIRDDPRLTRVGKLLRRWSVDELPQLWNVLRGDMSLVGPRPALPAEVAQYDVPLTRRLGVRPGITGLWQVSGRSDLSFQDYVSLDITYVQNWNILLDLYILLRTVPVVVSGRGAY